MISRQTQAADRKDLKALTAGSGSLGRNLLLSFTLALLVALALFALFKSALVSVALPLAFFLASAYSNVRFFGNVNRIQASPEAAVECIEVQASHIVDLEPHGSNGPVIAFLTEDGQCLLLVGQWLLQQRKFPSNHIRVYRWCSDGEPIRTESLGPKRKPVQSNAGLKRTHRVTSVQTFMARLESLEHDLDVALGRRDG